MLPTKLTIIRLFNSHSFWGGNKILHVVDIRGDSLLCTSPIPFACLFALLPASLLAHVTQTHACSMDVANSQLLANFW